MTIISTCIHHSQHIATILRLKIGFLALSAYATVDKVHNHSLQLAGFAMVDERQPLCLDLGKEEMVALQIQEEEGKGQMGRLQLLCY